MDIALIELWNQTVQKDDIVWYLGDFSYYKDPIIIDTLLEQLNGHKHLIVGNHDNKTVRNSKRWESVQSYHELRDTKHIVLFHYPISDWNGRFRNSWHLYGHTHNRFHPPLGEKSMDVGVDANQYKPISLDEVENKIKNGWEGPLTGWHRD